MSSHDGQHCGGSVRLLRVVNQGYSRDAWDAGTGSMRTGIERRSLGLNHDPREKASVGTGLS